LLNPRDLVPESNMPRYPWLDEHEVDPATVTARVRALRTLGDPYTDEDVAGVAAAVEGKTELQALIAYLQGLGVATPRSR
jgi:cytochrome c oxidase cbb3-type subunit 2